MTCVLTPLPVPPAPRVCQHQGMVLAGARSPVCDGQLQSSHQSQAAGPVQEGGSWCCGSWCFPLHLHLFVFPFLNLCDDD